MRSFMKYWLFPILCVVGPTILSSADAPFSITITTPMDVFKAGAEIRANIVFKNTSDRVISLPRSPAEDRGEIFCDIEMRNADGKVVPETKYYRALNGKSNVETESKPNAKFEPVTFHGSIVVFDLKPGETLKDGLILNKLFDLTVPGKYSIRVQRRDDATKSLVTSNTATVTISE
jgi:hypothetical protein